MSRINDYILTLTPEEREKYKNIIEDFKKREIEIKENLFRANLYIDKFRSSIAENSKSYEKLKIQLDELKNASGNAIDLMYNCILSAKKDKEFQHD